MANMKPGFVTGANAIVKLEGSTTIAYATDVNYVVDVATIPIETLGQYEVHAHEPVAYGVSGSLSVIRYTENTTNIENTDDNGNPIANYEQADGGNVGQHLNPAQLLESRSFQLDIVEKTDGDNQDVFRVIDVRFSNRRTSLTKRGVMIDAFNFVGIIGTDSDIAEASRAANSGDIDQS